jgi:DNA-binding LacI/PurR family transcriptional regulator
MSNWQKLPAVSLLAEHLRDELKRGQWSGRMPGVIRLARELGAARNTVEGALRELERDGLLLPQGHGRGRVIAEAASGARKTGLRVGLIPYEAADRGLSYLIDLQYRLEEEGHMVIFSQKTLSDLQQRVDRVARVVKQTEADAWVVMAGSREVIDWFAARQAPAFALFGRRRDVMIAGAGPDKVPTMREVVRRLVGLGHRRVVLMVRSERRKPQPGAMERAFLEELEVHGISTGAYHLPDWEETAEGLLECLDGLFGVTPPTSVIFDEAFLFAAAQQHLARKGILAPRDVSLVCCDPPEVVLAWMRPTVAHIRWDHRPLVRRIVKWAANVSHGQKDLRQLVTVAEFVDGGTIGPVKQ